MNPADGPIDIGRQLTRCACRGDPADACLEYRPREAAGETIEIRAREPVIRECRGGSGIDPTHLEPPCERFLARRTLERRHVVADHATETVVDERVDRRALIGRR